MQANTTFYLLIKPRGLKLLTFFIKVLSMHDVNPIMIEKEINIIANKITAYTVTFTTHEIRLQPTSKNIYLQFRARMCSINHWEQKTFQKPEFYRKARKFFPQ